MGEEKTKSTSLKKTAYHEAGHAVAHHFLNLAFKYVSIIPNERESSVGHLLSNKNPNWFDPDKEISDRVRLRAEKKIMVLLAGHGAEKIYSNRHNWVGSSEDMRSAINLALYITGSDKEASAFFKWLRIRTEDWLGQSAHWFFVKILAEELLKKQKLKSEEVKEIIFKAAKDRVKRK